MAERCNTLLGIFAGGATVATLNYFGFGFNPVIVVPLEDFAAQLMPTPSIPIDKIMPTPFSTEVYGYTPLFLRGAVAQFTIFFNSGICFGLCIALIIGLSFLSPALCILRPYVDTQLTVTINDNAKQIQLADNEVVEDEIVVTDSQRYDGRCKTKRRLNNERADIKKVMLRGQKGLHKIAFDILECLLARERNRFFTTASAYPASDTQVLLYLFSTSPPSILSTNHFPHLLSTFQKDLMVEVIFNMQSHFSAKIRDRDINLAIVRTELRCEIRWQQRTLGLYREHQKDDALRIQNLESSNSTLLTYTSVMEDILKQKSATIADLTSEKRVLTGRMTWLEFDNFQLNQAVIEKQSELDTSRSDQNTLMERMRDCDIKFKGLTREHDALQAREKQSKIEEESTINFLQSQVRSLTTKSETDQKTIERQETKLLENKGDSEQKGTMIDNLRGQIQELEIQAEGSKTKTNQQEATLLRYKKDLEQRNNTVGDLHDQVVELKQQLVTANFARPDIGPQPEPRAKDGQRRSPLHQRSNTNFILTGNLQTDYQRQVNRSKTLGAQERSLQADLGASETKFQALQQELDALHASKGSSESNNSLVSTGSTGASTPAETEESSKGTVSSKPPRGSVSVYSSLNPMNGATS
ncbi:MAG: hypothetical protein Q9166_006506 [cf. Caloplaca sp. 2 TL-2023]